MLATMTTTGSAAAIDPASIDLSDINGFWTRPIEHRHAAFDALRERPGLPFYAEPELYFVPPGPGYYAVTRLDDIVTASRNPTVFTSGKGATSPADMPVEFLEFYGSMINMDDPRHARLRRIVSRGFTPKMLDALHENIAQYTHSGSKPCNMAATGEYVMGISFEYRANTNKAKGAPIDLVFPKEGLGWDLEAFGIMKGTKKLDAAKQLADWASSKDAMLLYGKNFAITAQPGVAAPLANVPKDYESRLVKMDFATTAANRERVLAEWTKRYDAKTEKR